MKHHQPKVSAVPTNVITGFLGVGKTTVIINLLKKKPANERWAVLVDEFGEVGVDGGLIEGNHNKSQDIFVREVPGGCMCCAAGLPMQVALNQLLARAQPDRLLIEPTGLGHPKEVLEVLSAEHYQDILDIQQCITLVDARKIADSRYTEHDTFNQQIDMADIIVGHKMDLYDEAAQQGLIDYVTLRRNQAVPICFAQKGDIDFNMLNGKSTVLEGLNSCGHHSHSAVKPAIDANDQGMPSKGYLKIANSGEGYQSIGWRFSPRKIFNRVALLEWLNGLKVERAKGIFITDDGVFGYNLTPDTLGEMALDDCTESHIEIIFCAKDLGANLLGGNGLANEDKLLSCIQ